jgi:hypothetical protein
MRKGGLRGEQTLATRQSDLTRGPASQHSGSSLGRIIAPRATWSKFATNKSKFVTHLTSNAYLLRADGVESANRDRWNLLIRHCTGQS